MLLNSLPHVSQKSRWASIALTTHSAWPSSDTAGGHIELFLLATTFIKTLEHSWFFSLVFGDLLFDDSLQRLAGWIRRVNRFLQSRLRWDPKQQIASLKNSDWKQKSKSADLQISVWCDALNIMRISPIQFRGYECAIHSLSRQENCVRATSLRGQ